VLVVGTAGLDEALRERGLVPVSDALGQVDAVVQGYSPDMTWRLLAEGAIAINRGVPWVATNLDPTVPSPRGRLPGNGSLVAALRHATGKEPVATGKPDPAMHRESVLRTDAVRPIVVGDRLDTDIEGAGAVGCPSLLVLSGVTSPAELLAAGPRLRPTYLAADVSGLLMTHPEVTAEPGGSACRGWSAELDDDAGRSLVLHDRGGTEEARADASSDGPAESDLDALRALCVAAWSRADDAPAVSVVAASETAAGALTRLGLIG
jgi:hypothetical protein